MPDLPAVVLDSCVLIPSRMRDFLLSLAASGCFRPVWNDVVLAEVAHQERGRHEKFGTSTTKARQIAADLIKHMTEAFDDSMISGWEHLDGTFGLPDPHDEHIVATAIIAHQNCVGLTCVGLTGFEPATP